MEARVKLRLRDYLILGKKILDEFKNVMENDEGIKTAIIKQ